MIKAILFDLDGTLLNIDMNYFLPKYFKKMAIMANEYGFENSETLAEKVFQSTAVMIGNKDPKLTNEEVFMKDFLNRWPYSENEIRKFFNYFYEKGFPQLKDYCQPIPGMRDMMAKIFEKGYIVVIATNSVFPMSAIKNRIEWAGLDGFDYSLITSYELMHFCKPHIEYYQEITDKIQVDPKDCIMIGNDRGEDIVSGKMGMTTFLVENMLIDKGDVDYIPDYRGMVEDLYKFIDDLKSIK
ncbi:hypothetical protein SYNTR_1599 [Candidatus Syntrophocurvum alkaliphilum]|uniref:Phosphoglycolate phosphatase n=1 Tax=Candidatus Syntrophocurvum alkaliphilum TaxID=2293317 RepID=A0A6I6DHC5_9FIRM|nr:HAD family hydrolase [Candidatus Syntrophocurvum alkaliphilum]QGU00193.1 hypothetical protein SYNTR_1599 [Candidatus Syntrophocurvum alkaliphilum]